MSRSLFALGLVAVVALSLVFASPRVFPQREVLRIASTTSLDDSGLLEALSRAYEKGRGDTVVTWIAVGTGQAIEIAKRGDADLLLSHNRELEDEYIRKGYGVHGVTVALNDFLIVGPSSDPAKIGDLIESSEAFRRIAQAGDTGQSVFISRGDRSGTNLRELSIWRSIQIEPAEKFWYIEAAAGMATTLRVANEKQGYTLSDRSTWITLAPTLSLNPLVEGDPILLNLYRAILPNPVIYTSTNYKLAEDFVLFLVSEEGQRVIASHQRRDVSLFRPAFEGFAELGIEDSYEEQEVGYWKSLLEGQRPQASFPAAATPLANPIIDGFAKAFSLLATGSPELASIVLLSLRVSGTAVLIAASIGIPLGSLLALRRFRGKTILLAIVNTFMGLPPVVVGLVLYLALSRAGPLGPLSLIFTPEAMIVAQVIIATPIVTGLTHTAVSAVDQKIKDAAVSLGATGLQQALLTLHESRAGIIAAVVVGLGRALSEVGAVLIVGGNIPRFTRTLTTAVAVETGKGAFDIAIALGIILLGLAFAINASVAFFQYRRPPPRVLSWLRLQERV